MFIAFQMVILQQDRHVTKFHAIRRRTEKRLEVWDSGRHRMLVEETLRTCAQYLTTSHREESEDHRERTYYSLVFQWKLRMAVR